MSTTEPSVVVLRFVDAAEHRFIQHPKVLPLWVCERCGYGWILDPDRNPKRQILRDEHTMLKCGA